MGSDIRQIVCHIDKDYVSMFHAIINKVNWKEAPLIAGRIFIAGLAQEMKKYDSNEVFEALPRETQLEIIKVRQKLKEDQQATLKWIASRNPDEDEAEILAEIAADLGLDFEEAMEFAKESPFAQIVAYSTSPDTKFGKCVQWLGALFTQNTEVQRGVVMKLGEDHGFTPSLINRAKKEVGVTSEKRTGGAWWWLAPSIALPDNNNNNNNNHTISTLNINDVEAPF